MKKLIFGSLIMILLLGACTLANKKSSTSTPSNNSIEVTDIESFDRSESTERCFLKRKNIIKNSSFRQPLSTNIPDSSGVVDTEDSWIFFTNSGGAGVAERYQRRCRVSVTNAGTTDWAVQLIQAPITLERGGIYKLLFFAKGDSDKQLAVKIGANGLGGWTAYLQKNYSVTNRWSFFETDFTMGMETDEAARFEFWFLEEGEYLLDHIILIKMGQEEIPEEGTKTEIDEDATENWELVWSDEFNGASVDTANWTFEIGNGHYNNNPGWGNNELQYYTDNNTSIENGNLVIEAREERISDATGTYDYTSTRMITQDKYEFTFGRVEIRAKLPKGQGIWPALWMLGADIDTNPWPNCGEIDIMELIGNKPSVVHGTVHGPVSGGGGVGSGYTLDDGTDFSDGFRIFSMEWDEDEVEFYLDDVLFHVVNMNEIGGTDWVFDHDHFFIFNIAVGGNWPGYPDATTVFPQKMYVDYIRVYQDTNPEHITGEEVWDSEYELNWSEPSAENPVTFEAIVNGDFSQDIVNDQANHPDNWFIWAGEGGSINSYGVVNGELKIELANLGSAAWNIQLNQWIGLNAGSSYRISFDARAEVERDINGKLLHPANYTTYIEDNFLLSTSMQNFSFSGTIPDGSDTNVNLSFELGNISSSSQVTAVYFDNITIEKLN
ncbi:MAG: carbohydrate binding domain-containing protein [Spirochaetes bacterium]|nr:carbohydrate binding domain-containing protein [Spirochaetota bacterium]